MIDLARLILELRPDLRKRFGFHLPGNTDAFLGWLLTAGTMEYAAFEDAPSLFADLQARGCGPGGRLTRLQYLVWMARPDVQEVFALPRQTKEYLGWFYIHGLEEHGYWRYLSPAERAMVLQLSEPWASRLRATLARVAEPPAPRIAFNERAFGECLNYNGYGDSTDDLHFHPAELYAALRPYTDPGEFVAASPVYARLAAGFRADLGETQTLAPLLDTPPCRVYVLPDAPWARRASGVFANHIAGD